MVLLQTILVLIVVYYAFKLLAKWLVPKFFNYAVKKARERFGQQFGGFQDFREQPSNEGGTTVSKKPFRKSNPLKKVGEYIDFEEID